MENEKQFVEITLRINNILFKIYKNLQLQEINKEQKYMANTFK